jgi:hypothetical protein
VHDGDGIVRYRIEAENHAFRGSVLAWGNDSDAAELAALLSAFPTAGVGNIKYFFGSPGSGVACLRFESLNSRGHCRVWVAITAEVAAEGGSEHDSASIAVDFVPAELDEFCRALAKFKPRCLNEAILNHDAS